MRAIWKGAVSFGLVAIGVKLYSATEEKDLRFHQVHRDDGGRIRYKKVCEICGEEVATADIVKGYDIGGGEMVLLEDEDFAQLPLSTSRAVDVLEFVPAEQIDPILYNKAYYLEPEPTAVKSYVLLRDALRDGEQVAIVKVALRQREQLATLRVRDDVLVLNTMLWPDEVRTPEFGFLGEKISVRPQELKMATSLIDSMSADFDPDEFTDDYREALQKVIDAKVAGEEIVAPPPTDAESGQVIDLMAALKASVAQARDAREEPAAEASGKAAPEGKAKPRKQAAKARAAADHDAEPADRKPAKKRQLRAVPDRRDSGSETAAESTKAAAKRAAPKKTTTKRAASRTRKSAS